MVKEQDQRCFVAQCSRKNGDVCWTTRVAKTRGRRREVRKKTPIGMYRRAICRRRNKMIDRRRCAETKQYLDELSSLIVSGTSLLDQFVTRCEDFLMIRQGQSRSYSYNKK
eukprot:scaffold11842_cov151-Amphora_coffeaeformis.AAC.4